MLSYVAVDEPRGFPAERFHYLYDEDQLADWVPQIVKVAKQTNQVHVVMNNCFSNYGTTNARGIARLLAEYQGRQAGHHIQRYRRRWGNPGATAVS